MKAISSLASMSTRTKIMIGFGAVVVVGVVGLIVVRNGRSHDAASGENVAATDVRKVADDRGTVRLAQNDSLQATVQVVPATGPQPLNLPGTLNLDPNRLVHVHARFDGEAISIGTTDDGAGGTRPLRFGDHVKRGQLLAIVWSKEIGEKKSELMDATSLLEANQAISARLEKLESGLVSERAKEEARREVEVSAIAVAKAERTLRSWRMTDEEIATIYDELKSIRQSTQARSAEVEKRWAEIEVRSAIDGVIVEKSFNVGDMVESSDDLFKVADLSRLQILANIYEEDLRAVRELKPEARQWTIDLKSDPVNNRLPGSFELIGSVIDPSQRTGVVMGWLDNSDGKLAVGQFITATINLPHDPNVMVIPASALIEEGGATSIFVEVDRGRREFERRDVKVVRRGVDTVYVDTKPTHASQRPLQVGERIVVGGAAAMESDVAVSHPHFSKRS